MFKEPYLMLSDGKSAHTLKWAKELEKFYDVYVVSLNGLADELSVLLGTDKCFDYMVPINVDGGNIGVLKSVGFVSKLIKSIQPAVINAHFITSYGTVACLASILAGYKGKIVLSAWGTDILVTPWKNKLYYYLTKFVLGKADLITSDAKFMSDKVKEIVNSARVMTFPFGVEKLPDMEYSDKDDTIFFSNRALEPNYNINKVVLLFSKLYQEDNNRKLVLANDGSQREELVNLVAALNLSDNVEFVGYLTKPQQAEYYKKSRWFISVPTSDSTSVSLLEAMSYGCVPIVSDLPANREWVTDGENGIIYKGEDLNLGVCDQHVAYDKNREIIKKHAIWSECIARYKSELYSGLKNEEKSFRDIFFSYQLSCKGNKEINSSFSFFELPFYRQIFMVFILIWSVVTWCMFLAYDIGLLYPVIIFGGVFLFVIVVDRREENRRKMQKLWHMRDKKRLDLMISVLEDVHICCTDKNVINSLIDEAITRQKENIILRILAKYRKFISVILTSCIGIFINAIFSGDLDANDVYSVLPICWVGAYLYWAIESILDLCLRVFSDYYDYENFIYDLRQVRLQGARKLEN
ncbi:glycosyltransferase [Anaerovibrio lipolyticus]|uniref:glycosyltransferase n=1 Tax=Anaerovibrio lipolyticus TaxID=82374 RepID=UPI00068AB1D9|nr:glycosyltransferase [Anaerovibrio lipolyticus]